MNMKSIMSLHRYMDTCMSELDISHVTLHYHVDPRTQRVKKLDMLIGSAFKVICDISLDHHVELGLRLRLLHLKVLPPSLSEVSLNSRCPTSSLIMEFSGIFLNGLRKINCHTIFQYRSIC
jgi:hypothetical protein